MANPLMPNSLGSFTEKTKEELLPKEEVIPEVEEFAKEYASVLSAKGSIAAEKLLKALPEKQKTEVRDAAKRLGAVPSEFAKSGAPLPSAVSPTSVEEAKKTPGMSQFKAMGLPIPSSIERLSPQERGVPTATDTEANLGIVRELVPSIYGETTAQQGTAAPAQKTPPEAPPEAPAEPAETLFSLIEKLQKGRGKMADDLKKESEGLQATLAKARQDYKKEVADAKSEYDQEKTAARWGEIAEMIGRNLTMMAAAYRQAKTGKDYLSGLDSKNIVDWKGQIQQARAELGTAIQLASQNREMASDELAMASKTRTADIKERQEIAELPLSAKMKQITEKERESDEERRWNRRVSQQEEKDTAKQAEVDFRNKVSAFNVTTKEVFDAVKKSFSGKDEIERAAAQAGLEGLIEKMGGDPTEVRSILQKATTNWAGRVFSKEPDYGDTISEDAYKALIRAASKTVKASAPIREGAGNPPGTPEKPPGTGEEWRKGLKETILMNMGTPEESRGKLTQRNGITGYEFESGAWYTLDEIRSATAKK